ncbi:hypothetical protein GJ744_007332 [Endocarpon pusillum]|uniref:C2H2-type domain-containing protein n=1 Tax=Endocarpon pusillum TaxID=364733 RepID=A0A8H7AMK2_9EURO|nr:hypothetical protein GJ744_007332 [Endocarpon pusillum]
MDVPRLSSPPSIRIYDPNPGFEGRYSRTSAQTSPPSFSTRASMPIPNARSDPAPPPLPPPPFIEDLARGHDTGWKFANEGAFRNSTLAPIKQGSSLHGGYRQPRLNTNTKSDDQPELLQADELGRKSSTVSTIRCNSQPDIQMGCVGAAEEDGQKPTSPSSLANQGLQGEMPLAQQSFQQTSKAYDKHLLSKIGKRNSPPRYTSQASGDIITSGLSRPPQAKDGSNLQRLSVSDVPAASFDPISRWVSSPASAGVSPGSKPGWRDYMEYRSPSVDSSAPSSAVDSDYYARLRDCGRGSLGGPRMGNDDASSSLPSRSNRGSYDQQACLTEPETDFPMEETGGLRKLNLGDRTPPHNAYRQPFSKQQGLKRRALSPPPEGVRDDRAAANSANPISDMHQRSGTGHSYPRSPNLRFHPNHGSMSSTSSAGPRNGSYASSVGLSAAGSSMTSISSIDRPSPGGTSPPSDLDPTQDSTLAHQISLNPPSLIPHLAASRSHLSQNPPESRSATVARAMSAQSATTEGRAANAPRIGGAYMCECCPKKPKKFESEEELRMHMMEKQYKCAYCTNRFKNKNEAERHQNSLHLRRHSWSCAAISGYEAAFHPSISPTSQTSKGPSGDACGYCGEEFSNFPRDWEARFDHLTNVHKFGECNQTKKFFRADHFRQHLKHSHAGTSGKWTNMLENACMKDEPPPDAAAGTVMEVGEPSQATVQTPTATPATPSVAEESELGS